MEDNLPQPASKEFTFAGAPIDIRSLSLIDPSTYEPPAAGGNARVALGKVKTRRTRQRADGPMQQASSKFIHRTVTERKLFQAATSGDQETVERILSDEDEVIDVSVQDSAGRTALHIAAAAGNNPLVRLLLAFGANPNLQDQIGNTPLHLAACTSKVATVTLLLGAGTDVSLVDCRGATPVRLAQARLKHLRQNYDSMTFQEHAQAVEQIAFMMREYARCVGDKDGVGEVFDITAKLSNSTNQEEVTEVAGLLESFTSMKLQAGS